MVLYGMVESKKDKYIPRLIDAEIEEYLAVFGAVDIVGPKWCGKTMTGLNHSKSVKYLDNENTLNLALLDPDIILEGQTPILLDEWNRAPRLWDKIRRKCDEDGEKGKFILTCSTHLPKKEENATIFHSGVGRFGKIKMHTMSLYETGDSSGKASITKMLNETQENVLLESPKLLDLAYYIIRGGWPNNLKTPRKYAHLLSRQYINVLLDNDIKENANLNSREMIKLIRSLAKNESTLVTNKKLFSDTLEDKTDSEERDFSYKTFSIYLDMLYRLYVLEDQEAYDSNIRSSVRVGVSSKRHFADVSLAAGALGLTEEKLLNNLPTFGFLFESLVIHDLRVYMEALGGNIYHLHLNSSNKEADAVLEFENGDYALVEVKLGYHEVEKAKKSLMELKSIMTTPPVFMMVVVGMCNAIIRDKETGIYIVPLTALKP